MTLGNIEKYPRQTKLSPEELEKYLAADKIICLICGKKLKSLNGHVKVVHRGSLDDYKEMFGIPLWVDLCTPKSRKKRNLREKGGTLRAKNFTLSKRFRKEINV